MLISGRILVTKTKNILETKNKHTHAVVLSMKSEHKYAEKRNYRGCTGTRVKEANLLKIPFYFYMTKNCHSQNESILCYTKLNCFFLTILLSMRRENYTQIMRIPKTLLNNRETFLYNFCFICVDLNISYEYLKVCKGGSYFCKILDDNKEIKLLYQLMFFLKT